MTIGPFLHPHLDRRTCDALLCVSKQLYQLIVKWACLQPTPRQIEEIQKALAQLRYQNASYIIPCNVGNVMLMTVCIIFELQKIGCRSWLRCRTNQEHRFAHVSRHLRAYHGGLEPSDVIFDWDIPDTPSDLIRPGRTGIIIQTTEGHRFELEGLKSDEPLNSPSSLDISFVLLNSNEWSQNQWLLLEANRSGRIFANSNLLALVNRQAFAHPNECSILAKRIQIVTNKIWYDMDEDEARVVFFNTARGDNRVTLCRILRSTFASYHGGKLKVVVVSTKPQTLGNFCANLMNYEIGSNKSALALRMAIGRIHTALDMKVQFLQGIPYELHLNTSLWTYLEPSSRKSYRQIILQSPATDQRGRTAEKEVVMFIRIRWHQSRNWVRWRVFDSNTLNPKSLHPRMHKFQAATAPEAYRHFTFLFWYLTGNTWIAYLENKFEGKPNLWRPVEQPELVAAQLKRELSPKRKHHKS